MMETTQQVVNMEQPYQGEQTIHNREGYCPTCGGYAEFIFLGEQRWPQRLVELTGCPPVSYLFTCGHCNTTVTDTEIES
jgi:hypothetical protein